MNIPALPPLAAGERELHRATFETEATDASYGAVILAPFHTLLLLTDHRVIVVTRHSQDRDARGASGTTTFENMSQVPLKAIRNVQFEDTKDHSGRGKYLLKVSSQPTVITITVREKQSLADAHSAIIKALMLFGG